MKKSKIYVFSTFFILFVVVLLISYSGQRMEVDNRIEAIFIKNNKYLPTQNILNFAKLNSKEDFKNLKLEILIDRLEKHPYIDKVESKFIDSISVEVSIEEAKPIAMIFDNDEILYVTENKILLPPDKDVLLNDLPLISGVDINKRYFGKKINPNSKLDLAFKIIENIKQIDEALFETVSEIDVYDINGVNIFLSKPRCQISIGDSLDIRKTIYLSEFWRKVILKQEEPSYEYIDLRFKDQIVVKEKSKIQSLG